MAEPDLLVIITAHREGIVAGPTVQSAEAAIAAAEARGLSVERRVALDRPDPVTADFFAQEAMAGWDCATYDFGDPFQSRNAAAEAAHGRWIAFVDGDDLVSENWLWRAAERLKAAPEGPPHTIVHPELNWIFDAQTGVFAKRGQDDPLFLPQYFYFDNYYDMMCVCPRALVLDVPYAPRDIDLGFGFQDWQWNMETMHAGHRHVVARDTIIFKRRREGSVSQQNRQRGGVVKFTPGMAIDKVRDLHGPGG